MPILHLGIEASLMLSKLWNYVVETLTKDRLYRTSWKHIEHAKYTSKNVAILMRL